MYQTPPRLPYTSFAPGVFVEVPLHANDRDQIDSFITTVYAIAGSNEMVTKVLQSHTMLVDNK